MEDRSIDTATNLDVVFSGLSDDHLLQVLQQYVDKWTIDVTWTNLYSVLQVIFGVQSPTDYDEQFGIINKMLLMLGSELHTRNLMDTKDRLQTLVQYNQLLEKVHYAQHLLRQYTHFVHTSDVGHDFNSNIDTTMFKFQPLVYDDMKPFQKLVFTLLNFLGTCRYRKHNEYVYEEVAQTRAWKPKCKIIELVQQQCNMTSCLSNWYLVTSAKDVDKQLTDYLMRSQDDRFPVLKRNRNIFSFQNGIYFCMREDAVGVHLELDVPDLFLPYDTPEYTTLASSVTACKYFPLDFTFTDNTAYADLTSVLQIPTPYIDSIFEYQKLAPEVIQINKMFLGRMLYDVGRLDNWQVILMLIGAGGTGKSTITNIVRMMYDSDDVGIMGNNFSKTFGLADIYDKFSFIAPEVKRDWGIDQAEFQEIVSGGKINVNIKHQLSQRVQWTAPGMLAGNENPGFVDNASSIQRRVVVTRFDLKVADVNPQLTTHLEHEIGAILKQCNRLYLHYVQQFAQKDIWKWLPPYFVETQELMASATNALHAFLKSNLLQFDPDAYMPATDFWRHFNIFCNANNFQKPKINVDYYRSPFASHNLTMLRNCSRKYPPRIGRLYKNVDFVTGVNMRTEDDDAEDNENMQMDSGTGGF